MAPRIGFIGLGAMGAPMVRRLLQHGHPVTVWARRAEAMAPIVAAGGHAGTSPADVAAASDVVITMVLDGRAVEAVALGEHGIVHAARPGLTVVDHSTVEPDTARRVATALADRGSEMLDAPVSGGSLAAEAGTLAIMAGGPRGAFERATPIFAAYAARVVHIGDSGAGQVAKACNQICTIVNQLGAAEAMLLAERCGVDPKRVHEALMGGFAASRMLELQAPKMIARDFEGRIESRLHDKDIRIVLALAKSLGIELPASAAAADVLGRLQQRGGARQDSAAVFDVLDKGQSRRRSSS